jgi:chorismate synthase
MELSYVTMAIPAGPTVVVSGAGRPRARPRAIRRDLAGARAMAAAQPEAQTDDVVANGGLRHGRTLGSPIAFFIENRDHKN